ncbi:DUF7352 domain-containing protein [Parapedobacter indicus]|uniref:DUF7352 domain-containing protein n=1 Tax=Parapedobacter indicus TaxID=1477437 RepID=A0A1I3E4M5_9SPHI|nr:hypothetical protein [Parapedobacter indicus]PPL04961.1 hypothetical protein CLV26_101772 [Parapedobacter indicus]SFH93763.1 hypothetical protein SAMN05444682_101758 [Parapedobacter indicus]
MRAIYKYILPMKEESTIKMPYAAKVIMGENQDGFVAIWAIVDTDAPEVDRHFRLYKTGQEIKESPERLRFIGRADIHVGMDLGMHIFELLKDEEIQPAPYTT